MRLTTTQALEIAKDPKNVNFINLARHQESRLILHCEPVQEQSAAPDALNNFLAWVASFLPKDKFEKFSKLVQLPIETVDSTASIFDELSKFFNAPDGFIKNEFTSPTIEQDFNDYLKTIPNYEDFWEVHGFKALQTGINSFIVCDLPTVQKTLRPEPYFYILSIFSVRDVEINEKTGAVEYICFTQKDKSIIVIDDNAYRKFTQPDNGELILEPQNEYIHSTYTEAGDLIEGLGYAPVCSFYRNSIKGSKGINKVSPITTSLSKLDWLLFWRTSNKYLQLYGAYPVVVSYKEKCDYRDKDGNECREGYVNFEYENRLNSQIVRSQKLCPVCEKRGLIGAGTHLKVDPPRDKDEVDLMQNPVKFIEISNDKLEFGVKEIQRLEEEIEKNCIGYVAEVSKDAINEKQVESQFESRKAKLDNIRTQFEQSRKFTMETVARLRYGSAFKQATVFMGKEYFLQSPMDLMDKYLQAKKAGLPYYEIASIRESYTKTKFKNNIQQYTRFSILAQLEPFPDLSINEMRANGIDIMFPDYFALKIDFANFIAKFEREQMNVVEFGSLIPLGDKINIITKKLLSYVKDRKPQISPQPNSGGVGGASPQSN